MTSVSARPILLCDWPAASSGRGLVKGQLWSCDNWWSYTGVDHNPLSLLEEGLWHVNGVLDLCLSFCYGVQTADVVCLRVHSVSCPGLGFVVHPSSFQICLKLRCFFFWSLVVFKKSLKATTTKIARPFLCRFVFPPLLDLSPRLTLMLTSYLCDA